MLSDDGQPGFPKGLFISLPAAFADHGAGCTAGKGDMPMPQRDQVSGGQVAAHRAMHMHRVEGACGMSVERHHGNGGFQQTLDDGLPNIDGCQQDAAGIHLLG